MRTHTHTRTSIAFGRNILQLYNPLHIKTSLWKHPWLRCQSIDLKLAAAGGCWHFCTWCRRCNRWCTKLPVRGTYRNFQCCDIQFTPTCFWCPLFSRHSSSCFEFKHLICLWFLPGLPINQFTTCTLAATSKTRQLEFLLRSKVLFYFCSCGWMFEFRCVEWCIRSVCPFFTLTAQRANFLWPHWV